MNQLQALYQLQVFESSLDTAKARVEEIETALKSDAEVLRCRHEYEACQERVRHTQAAVTDLELEIAALEAKHQEGEKLLYSGAIKNPKELQDLENEVSSLKRR